LVVRSVSLSDWLASAYHGLKFILIRNESCGIKP